ncbi:MAG: hypothetical protein LCH73_02785 [Proteobacteria bacterium]|nr:hypothetical protein [Pseudomonadota bacterium]
MTTLEELKSDIEDYIYNDQRTPEQACAALRDLASFCDLHAMAITEQHEDNED